MVKVSANTYKCLMLGMMDVLRNENKFHPMAEKQALFSKLFDLKVDQEDGTYQIATEANQWDKLAIILSIRDVLESGLLPFTPLQQDQIWRDWDRIIMSYGPNENPTYYMIGE